MSYSIPSSRESFGLIFESLQPKIKPLTGRGDAVGDFVGRGRGGGMTAVVRAVETFQGGGDCSSASDGGFGSRGGAVVVSSAFLGMLNPVLDR